MTGRVFAVTGASGVLGSAVAKAAAAQGGRVALIDHAKHSDALAACGPEAIMLGGVDLTDAVAAGAAIDAVADRFGGLDAVINVAGGFKATGRSDEEARQVTRDAEAMAEAGAFAVVLEGTLEPVAAAITASISIPTIGIGASPACDGQILVSEDVFGLFSDFTPRFVKRYADLGPRIAEAAAAYSADVKARRFPAMEHCFLPKSGGQSRQ